MRRSAQISATRASGATIASSPAIWRSVKPPGARVVQVATWISPLVKTERRGEIVRHALVAKSASIGKSRGTVGIGEPAAQGHAGVVDMHDRALEIFAAFQHRIGRGRNLDRFVGLPGKAPPHRVRMERPHEHRRPIQRHPASDQAIAKLRHDGVGRRRRPRAVDQPLDDGSGVVLQTRSPSDAAGRLEHRVARD